jgi:hypothetical protein
MSTSAKPQTQTTVAEPPKYLIPHLNHVAFQANELYGQGGTPVPAFSGQTQQALNMAEQRALAGSPVSGAAQNYATQTLNGGFMGKNPWLDQAMSKASGAVTNQVQSNFGTSGRNPRGIDAAGFAQEGYNDLAAQIYGGDYQAERGRMQQMVPFAGQLANQDYADIGQLSQVGATYDDQAREQAGAPGRALDEYLMRLQGHAGGTTTSAIPTERNRLAGAAGGAMTGAMFGPWGALAGGVLGGLYG